MGGNEGSKTSGKPVFADPDPCSLLLWSESILNDKILKKTWSIKQEPSLAFVCSQIHAKEMHLSLHTLKYFLYRRTACIADWSQLTLIWV